MSEKPLDEDSYDFLLTFRDCHGEYDGAACRDIKEFKMWIMANIKFSKQELVDLMTETTKCSNYDVALAEQESHLPKFVEVCDFNGDMVMLTYGDGTSEVMSREKMRAVVLGGYRYFNKEVCGG